MDRRKLALLVVAFVAVASAVGWIAGSRVRSPAEEAARTAPPAPSPILVPVESKVLSTDVLTRGTARFGSPLKVSLAPSALKTGVPLLTRAPVLGGQLAEGDVALVASGRPVFVLTGQLPAYRDLGPGIEGGDVRQLQEALVRLGFDPGPANGVYGSQTEQAVAAWYRAAGFAPFEATTDQLAAVRRLEGELATARLDLLSGQTSVAAAEADLAKAQAAYAAALATSNGSGGAITAAEADARAAEQRAAADLAAKQAALDALVQGVPGTNAQIAALQSDLVAATAAATEIGLTGQQSVAAAGADRDVRSRTLATATAQAAAADQTQAIEVAAKQGTLDALLRDPSATAVQVAGARAGLVAALATADATRLAGEQSVADAAAALAAAPRAIDSARAGAAAADQAAASRVLAAQTALDASVTGSPGTAAQIAVAAGEVDAAAAVADAARAAGAQAVIKARTGQSTAGDDVRAAAIAVQAAEQARANALSAVATRSAPLGAVEADLGLSMRRAGVQVPADELIFVTKGPLRVAEVPVVAGNPAVGVIMTATESIVAVDTALPLEEAPLVAAGMKVNIDEPALGLTATGVVSRVAETPGTNGVDAFHIYLEVLVDGSPPQLVGSSVRLTIPVESTGGSVLAVPVAAVSLTADGSSRIQRDTNGTLDYVTVEPGLSAKGFVGVKAVGTTLNVGDMVVIGYDQPAVKSG